MKKLLIFSFLFLLSCASDDDTRYLPNATGVHGEILVIMDDGLWNGVIGETLISKMSEYCEGPYLRPEPLFSYSRVTPEGLNHLNQMNRLLLKIMVDPDSVYATTQMLEISDYYAKGQLFVILKDSDVNRLYSFVLNEFGQIAASFNKFEREYYRKLYLSDPNKNVMEASEENFGLGISIPNDSELKVEKDSFMWVKRDRSHNMMSTEPGAGSQTYWIQQGILFWSVPFRDLSQLSADSVLQIRDTILRYNVPGKFPRSYMATEYDSAYCPEAKKIEFGGKVGLEVRGLWKHAGDPGAMGGGPFVQWTVIQPERNLLVTVCGYIHAPKFDKREYIREIDAMLSTLSLRGK